MLDQCRRWWITINPWNYLVVFVHHKSYNCNVIDFKIGIIRQMNDYTVVLTI